VLSSSASAHKYFQINMKELILNADDFGLTTGVNEGIIRAHRQGVLTSATLMATGHAFDDAVERARATTTLGIGCHLVLTGGIAISRPEEIPSLADKRGVLPDSLATFVARVSSGKVRAGDIAREIRAQVEKIRRAGIEPTHFDSHKHTHAHPSVMKVLAQVSEELRIKCIRNPIESLRHARKSLRSGPSASSKQLAAVAAVRLVASRFTATAKKHGLQFPDNFLGVALTGKLDAEALVRLIDTLPVGRTEIMLHPGICDSELVATGSRLQRQRELELDALLAPEVRRAIERHEVRMISYRDLN
jgi:chitin disaccharide deacetylase